MSRFVNRLPYATSTSRTTFRFTAEDLADLQLIQSRIQQGNLAGLPSTLPVSLADGIRSAIRVYARSLRRQP